MTRQLKDAQEELYKKYPKLFRQKDLSIQESCMLWGICFSLGWFPILESVCDLIENHIEQKQEVQFEFTQIKEKFGSMRLYYIGGDDFVDGVISMAESMSHDICELCGKPGKINKEGYWLSCRCEECRKEEEDAKNNQKQSKMS